MPETSPIIPISETRDHVSNELDERQVLINGRQCPMFATFYPNGATELLKVAVGSGRADSFFIPGAVAHALVRAFLDYHVELQEQVQHAAFLAAQKAAEAATGPTQDQPTCPCGKPLFMPDPAQAASLYCSVECFEKYDGQGMTGAQAAAFYEQSAREAADNAEPDTVNEHMDRLEEEGTAEAIAEGLIPEALAEPVSGIALGGFIRTPDSFEV